LPSIRRASLLKNVTVLHAGRRTTIQIGSAAASLLPIPQTIIAERFGTLETATQEREPAATLADSDLNGLRHGTVARQN
jgi:hypothetical protein